MTKPIGSKRPLTNHFNSRSVTWIPPLHGSSVRRKDFPKFKSKKAPRHSFQFVQSVSVDFDSHRVKMPKVGWVKFFKNRTFDGKIGTVAIIKTATGKYFMSVLVDDGKDLPIKAPITVDTTVCIECPSS